MYHLVNNLTNRKGAALTGYYVKLRVPDGAYATIYADKSGTPIISASGIADTAITDDDGLYDIYVDDGDYDIDFFDKKDINLRIRTIPAVPMYGSGLIDDAAAATAAAATATDAAADALDTLAAVETEGATQLAALQTEGATQVALAAGHAADAGAFADTAAAAVSAADVANQLITILGQLGAPPEQSVIDTNGWSATWATPVDLTLNPVKVLRHGYDSAGLPTTYVDTLYVTKRVREVYPTTTSNLAPVFTSNKVALSDYVYSTDAILGVTNNSGEVSPKPTAQWVMPSRLTVGTSVHWEMIAFHRNARSNRQVACVKVRATDGTNYTAWQTVSTTAISTLCEDANPVPVFKGDLDVTSLNAGLIWLEAEVYPWIGTTASVRRTSDETARKAFSVRYFYKNAARAATAPRARVASTGNDTTGAWTTDGSAPANAFLTVAGALAKVNTQITNADGGQIEVVDTVAMGTVSVLTSVAQYGGAVTVTRASSTARASAVVQIGAAGHRTGLGTNNTLLSPLTEGAIVFKDVSVIRSGASSFSTSTFSGGTETKGLYVQWWNVNFDNNSQVSTYLSASGGAVHDGIFGITLTNMVSASSVLGVSGTTEHRILRGLSCSDFKGAQFQGYAMSGCSLSNPGTAGFATAGEGALVTSCKFLKTTTGAFTIESGDGVTCSRLGFANVLVEQVGTSTTVGGIIIGGNSGNTTHAILHHVTVTGAQSVGRANMFYDNQDSSVGGEQTHKLMSVKGCVFPQYNIKGDIFRSSADGADGNFAPVHGVGFEGIYSMYSANAPASEHPTYAGLNGDLGSSSTAPQDAEGVLFTDYKGTTAPAGVLTAGPGGGNYAPAVGSPLRGMVTSSPVLGFDLAGVARGTGSQAAGAYA